jgi:hypothetical protein
MSLSAYPESWTAAEREEYKAAYLADKPVATPFPEHDEGECEFCDTLRALRREADEEEDAKSS